MQESHLVLHPGWKNCLPGPEHRGHVAGFMRHTQHMVDPQYMARLAMKETSHMQPKHPEGGKGHQGKECGQMERKGTEQN